MAGTPAARIVGRSAILRFVLRTALWLLLGGWIGAWLLFGGVVAPTAFRTLPSTEVAGLLIGPVLTWLHLYGAAAGIASTNSVSPRTSRSPTCVKPAFCISRRKSSAECVSAPRRYSTPAISKLASIPAAARSG